MKRRRSVPSAGKRPHCRARICAETVCRKYGAWRCFHEAIRPDAELEPEPVSELVEIEGLEDQPLLDSEDEDGEVDETEEADEDRQTV